MVSAAPIRTTGDKFQMLAIRDPVKFAALEQWCEYLLQQLEPPKPSTPLVLVDKLRRRA